MDQFVKTVYQYIAGFGGSFYTYLGLCFQEDMNNICNISYFFYAVFIFVLIYNARYGSSWSNNFHMIVNALQASGTPAYSWFQM